MKRLLTLAAVAVLALGPAETAFARGGDGGEGRAALRAEFEKSRERDRAEEREEAGKSSGGFLDRLFGSDDDESKDATKTRK